MQGYSYFLLKGYTLRGHVYIISDRKYLLSLDNDNASCAITLTQPAAWFSNAFDLLIYGPITFYSNDVDCTWSFTAEEGMRIKLTFTFFDIEADGSNACSFDFLQVSFRLFRSTNMNAQHTLIYLYNLYQRKPNLYI